MYGCVFAHMLAPESWNVCGDLRVIYRKELALSFCPVGRRLTSYHEARQQLPLPAQPSHWAKWDDFLT